MFVVSMYLIDNVTKFTLTLYIRQVQWSITLIMYNKKFYGNVKFEGNSIYYIRHHVWHWYSLD